MKLLSLLTLTTLLSITACSHGHRHHHKDHCCKKEQACCSKGEKKECSGDSCHKEKKTEKAVEQKKS